MARPRTLCDIKIGLKAAAFSITLARGHHLFYGQLVNPMKSHFRRLRSNWLPKGREESNVDSFFFSSQKESQSRWFTTDARFAILLPWLWFTFKGTILSRRGMDFRTCVSFCSLAQLSLRGYFIFSSIHISVVLRYALYDWCIDMYNEFFRLPLEYRDTISIYEFVYRSFDVSFLFPFFFLSLF